MGEESDGSSHIPYSAIKQNGSIHSPKIVDAEMQATMAKTCQICQVAVSVMKNCFYYYY